MNLIGQNHAMIDFAKKILVKTSLVPLLQATPPGWKTGCPELGFESLEWFAGQHMLEILLAARFCLCVG